MKLNVVSVIVAVLACLTSIYADEAFIVLKSGNAKIKPANNRMLASSNGSVKFTDVIGKPHTYTRGQIKFIYSDRPKAVAIIENLYRNQRYDDVIKAFDKLTANDIYLGWGGVAYYLKAMAELQLNKLSDASTTLKKGMVVAMAEDRDGLLRDGLKIVQAVKSPGRAPNKVNQLNLVLKGIEYEGQKKYRESALEYMKVVMLYPPNDKRGTDLERLVAMSRLVNVLKTGKDMGAAGRFAETMKAEM